MLPILGIDHVAINVKDLEKSLEFYSQILGLSLTKREFQKPGIEYFLDCGQGLIGLIQSKPGSPEHLFQNDGLGANHFSFRVRAQEFDGVLEKLKAAGVSISFFKKREKSWSLYFLDLDGNKLEITAWPQEDLSAFAENPGL